MNMAAASVADKVELDYVEGLFFQVLDSIRYARDKYNPAYVTLAEATKRQTTARLKEVARHCAPKFLGALAVAGEERNDRQFLDNLKAECIDATYKELGID